MPLYSPLTHKLLRRARKNAADRANSSAPHRRHLDDVVLARVKGEIWDPPFALDLNILERKAQGTPQGPPQPRSGRARARTSGWRSGPAQGGPAGLTRDGVQELAGVDLEELPGMDLQGSLEANEQGSPGVQLQDWS